MRRDHQRVVFAAVLVAAFLFAGVCGARAADPAHPPRHDAAPSFADLAEKAKPAVVNISTTKTVRTPGDPFEFFFGPRRPFDDPFGRSPREIPQREMKRRSLGSGFIIDRSGIIVTNNHIVAGAEDIEVRTADGRSFPAEVLGRDAKTDLAVIKIAPPEDGLQTMTWADSDRIRVGDWVLAIGNPFGLNHTVTRGIISAKGRVIGSGPYDDFLQTDAPINPGNSGGPLIDMSGAVVGINTAVATGKGLGFAIPANQAKAVIAQLRERGRVIRGWIGVTIQGISPAIAKAMGLKTEKGILISDVQPGSPADRAGIQRGDVIVGYDGRDVGTVNELPALVADTPVGKTVKIKVLREGRLQEVSATVGEMVEEEAQAKEGQPEDEDSLVPEDEESTSPDDEEPPSPEYEGPVLPDDEEPASPLDE